MKTTLLRQAIIILCAVGAGLSDVSGQNITATYIGQPGGNWNDPANWSPQAVPNDDATHSYDVSVGAQIPGVFQDVDVTLNSLTLTDDASTVWPMDHNLIAAATNLGLNFVGEPYGGGIILLSAMHRNLVANLGILDEFSGTTFMSGNLIADASAADPGVSSTIGFNGADIRESGGDIQFVGARSFLQDENGNDAIRHFQHNLPSGIFHFEYGRNFTTEGSLINEGECHIFAMFTGTPIDSSDHGFSALTTLTVSGDLTMLGPDAEGYIEMISKGVDKDAQVTVKGVITDYDATKKTLNGGQYELTAGEGGGCNVQVLGGSFDIVDIESFMSLIGPNTGFLDSFGTDALRNLAQTGPSAYFRIGDRDFTTAGSFTSAGILTIRGNGRFIVLGDLTVIQGLLHVSEQTGYAFEGTLGNYTGATEFGNSVVNVTGNLTLAHPATMRFDIAPSTATARLQIAGNASLAGNLTVFLTSSADGTKPEGPSGNGRTLMTAGSISGSFDNVKSGDRVLAYSADDVAVSGFDGKIAGTYKVTNTGTALQLTDFQPRASMLNISTRVDVQPNDSGSAICGFIIRGGAPKKLIVRGIGPSLAEKGVSNALPDPTLELHDSTGAVVVANDNWQSSQEADIEATGIAPTDMRESAIVATLDPGSYTAVMRGAENSTGVALVELYDLDDQPAAAEVANLSTRGFVGANENVMIGGTIIGSDTPANTVVRAIGPSLASKDVVGSLQDPVLELRDASGVLIMSNDNWQDNASQAASIQAVGLAPTDMRESALAITLQPGNYTAIVRGKNSSQGVALVEFYKLN